MKKLFLSLLLFLMITATFAFSASAVGSDTEELLDGLSDEARAQMEDVDVSATIDADGTLKNIFGAVEEKLSDILKDSAKNAAAVLLASILCALINSIYGNKNEGIDYINLAGTAVIGAIAISGADSLIETAVKTVDELQVFSNTLLPTLTASAAAGGAISSSAAKYSATMLFVGITTNLGKTVVTPLIYIYLAVSAGAAAFDGGLGGAAELIKKAINFILSGVAIAFTLYITLTGTIAASADVTAVKLTKAAVSGVLPVVGGIISDAAEAVVSGAGILKNSVSVFGMLAVCALCALPFVRLLVNVFIFKAAAMLSGTVAPKRISGFIDAVGTALTLTLAFAGTSAVMLFISIVSFMKTVIV